MGALLCFPTNHSMRFSLRGSNSPDGVPHSDVALTQTQTKFPANALHSCTDSDWTLTLFGYQCGRRVGTSSKVSFFQLSIATRALKSICVGFLNPITGGYIVSNDDAFSYSFALLDIGCANGGNGSVSASLSSPPILIAGFPHSVCLARILVLSTVRLQLSLGNKTKVYFLCNPSKSFNFTLPQNDPILNWHTLPSVISNATIW